MLMIQYQKIGKTEKGSKRCDKSLSNACPKLVFKLAGEGANVYKHRVKCRCSRTNHRHCGVSEASRAACQYGRSSEEFGGR